MRPSLDAGGFGRTLGRIGFFTVRHKLLKKTLYSHTSATADVTLGLVGICVLACHLKDTLFTSLLRDDNYTNRTRQWSQVPHF